MTMARPAEILDRPTWWDTFTVIRVLLVEDMDLLRTALVSLLSDQDDMDVVGAVGCAGDGVVRVALRTRPSVVVMDVDRDGLSVVAELRRRLPNCQIVALIAANPAAPLRALLAADVLGVVDKNAPVTGLLEAIRKVAKGQRVLDASLAVAALAGAPNPLTRRERDVLRLAAEGNTGSEIAAALYLTPGTVRNYLSRAITKTSARSRIEAIRIAREAGWM
jgi:two-component system response regulator DesR